MSTVGWMAVKKRADFKIYCKVYQDCKSAIHWPDLYELLLLQNTQLTSSLTEFWLINHIMGGNSCDSVTGNISTQTP